MSFRYGHSSGTGPKSRTGTPKSADNFAGALHESTLHAELAAAVGVPADFEGVDTDGDAVLIELATEPDPASKAAIDAVCAAH